MYKTLLVDIDPEHADRVIRRLSHRKLNIQVVSDIGMAESELQNTAPPFELVIMNVSDSTQPWIPILGGLQQACRSSFQPCRPLFLCVSTRRREPLFELEIERRGARYVLER